jgi:hypothetical protein
LRIATPENWQSGNPPPGLPPEIMLAADVDALIDGECVDFDYRCFPIHHLD